MQRYKKKKVISGSRRSRLCVCACVYSVIFVFPSLLSHCSVFALLSLLLLSICFWFFCLFLSVCFFCMVLVLLYGSGSFLWFWFFRSASVWSTQNSRCPEGLLRTSCWCSRLLFLHQFEAGWLTGSDCWYWEQRSFTTAPSFFQSQANYWSLEAAQKGSLTG